MPKRAADAATGQPLRTAAAGASVSRAMAATREALASDPAAMPDLGALVAAAGVSHRGLQRHFVAVTGMSPRAAVERLRLDAARQTLRSGTANSVLDAAIQHGFEHPGRFAIAYARAFGESPSATLRANRAQARTVAARRGTPIVLEALLPMSPADASLARRATDDLAIALGTLREVELLLPEAPAPPDSLRLAGRVEQGVAILSLRLPSRGRLLLMLREPLSRNKVWAGRVVVTLRDALTEQALDRARRTPRRRADVETLVIRARPAALSQERDLTGIALDLLDEALLRDPAHATAHALAGFARSVAANQSFVRDPAAERLRAVAHAESALGLAADDPEVLSLAAGTMSLSRQLDRAELLVRRSLMLDQHQPEAARRLGFILNFRGDGGRAAEAFLRALRSYPSSNDASMALIGLGVARFISADYARSARTLSRAINLQPARMWPHRFLAAAAMQAGATEEARRSLAALRHWSPDITVSVCAQSDALHPEALGRVLDGLARAGLPR